MRRQITGALMPAAAGTFALAAPAEAAAGVLAVNGVPHGNPQRGCYPTSSPVLVHNRTDTTVLVHAEATCQGPVTAQVEPGQCARTLGAGYVVF
ncbi:hypothetical protein ACFV1W_37380 [Kitasatospora sp. NPDC059648]|uniref:hypothetical protein n=1 Tax=Kitasatospora sp. NPDC059648 TaxID=3346894 RepID=UPI003689BBC2